jgi:hypothetical protein
MLVAGLPDGIFSKNPNLGKYVFEGLAREDIGIFYDH